MARLDQFYTRPDIARRYALSVAERWHGRDVLLLEPSAGDGAFVEPLLGLGLRLRAVDLQPAHPLVRRADFLTDDVLGDLRDLALVVLGNPPFGKNASLAIRFLNRAAEIGASEIAFVVPRTFRKASVHNRLDPRVHLASDEDVPPYAFLRDGQPYDVPCAWQVWERRASEREQLVAPDVSHLIRYVPQADADFAFRRVGWYAGRVVTEDIESLSPTTHYFARAVVPGVEDALRSVEWPEVSSQTVGSRSISKYEIAVALREMTE